VDGFKNSRLLCCIASKLNVRQAASHDMIINWI